MGIHTTEITSANIPSDNPIHQRLLFAYEAAVPYLKGDLLELGCGQGRGVKYLIDNTDSYTGIDKNEAVIAELHERFDDLTLLNMSIPPFSGLEDNSFDTVCTFQVIEHIEDDELFVKEIHRVLKPGGRAIISTPNIKMSLTRNPWHIREYTVEGLKKLLGNYFSEVDAKGVYGSDAANQYYERNKASVAKYKKLDIFNLEQRLPRSVLQVPYDILNRRNRNRLHQTTDKLVMSITTEDFSLKPADDNCFDLYYIATK